MKRINRKSRELDTSDINADGAKRNLIKFAREWNWCWRETRADRKRLFTHWRFLHNLINLVVENFRCAPYLWGHVAVFYLLAREVLLPVLTHYL